MQLKTGAIIDNRYEIKRYISSGGFGNTYEGFDNRLKAQVAIKELFLSTICSRGSDSRSVVVSNPQNNNNFEAHKRRFVREAQRLCRFTHPNIVRVIDVFEANGTAYFVMDYVEGMPLSRFTLPMQEKRLMKYLDQMLSALEHVHSKGILHLDLKPGNIMIDSNDNAILIDFGASKLIDSSDYTDNNASTVNAYTPGYAPLEQMSGDTDSLGPHSDIYALGATLYMLLSGSKPALPADLLLKPLAPLTGISPQLGKAINLSLKVLYPERIASVDQFRRILDGEEIDIAAERKIIEEHQQRIKERRQFEETRTKSHEPQPRRQAGNSLNDKTNVQNDHVAAPTVTQTRTQTQTTPKVVKPQVQPVQGGINSNMKPWDSYKPTDKKEAQKKNDPKPDNKKTIIALVCVITILAVLVTMLFWPQPEGQKETATDTPTTMPYTIETVTPAANTTPAPATPTPATATDINANDNGKSYAPQIKETGNQKEEKRTAKKEKAESQPQKSGKMQIIGKQNTSKKSTKVSLPSLDEMDGSKSNKSGKKVTLPSMSEME